MSAPSPLHVVFGFGPIGRAVISRLLREGARVRLAGRGDRPVALPSPVEFFRADATDPGSATRACAGATYVYNCTNARDYHRWPEQFPPLQRGVLAGARAAGAVLIAVENLYVYGPHAGAPLTEDFPLEGKGSRSSTRVAMTQELDAAHRSGALRVVRVRGSDLIGPGVIESMAGQRLFAPILEGRGSVTLLADPDLPHALTAVRDFAQTLVAAATDPRAHGKVFHVPSVAPTPRELIAAIAASAGLAAPTLRAPSRRALSVLLPLMGLVVPPLRGLTENTSMFYEPFTVDSSRAQQLLGVTATPLLDTVEESVRWYRAAQEPDGVSPAARGGAA